MARVAISFSAGIRKIAGLAHFVAVDRVVPPSGPWSAGDDVVVLLWGRKPNTAGALKFAEKHGFPVLYLEDGPIRTCARDAHSRMMYSMLVDQKGVYYDAASSNILEDFLNTDKDTFESVFSVSAHELSRACMEVIVEHNVTKYNFCSDFVIPEGFNDKPVVLVVDQTFGDASIEHGGMDPQAFEGMLDCAIDENPDARIIVKTHPDVVSGIRKGYLQDMAAKRGVEILSTACNPISLLKQVDHVYVGTSQMGMEALMCGVPVSVFGKPFYAGWGLTDDRQSLSRRQATRTLDELFFAYYVWYPRYLNPITLEHWTLPECLEHVLLQKRCFEQNARHFTGIGITPWKRRYIANYLRSPDGSVSYIADKQLDRVLGDKNCEAIVTWSYRMPALARTSNEELSCEVYRIEDGFLRSAGLGTDFSAPASLVIDGRGLYFNPKNPSELEHLLNHVDCPDEAVWRAKRLISLILSARLSKYNVGKKNSLNWHAPENKVCILVPGQVETDASIKYGCQDVNSNAELLLAVREANPDAWIVYKPHPDVVTGSRTGDVPETVLENTIDAMEWDADIVDCIEAVDELHTMTSLSGFEALLRGKKVVTYGSPFYAGWGLTTDKQSLHARRRQRTLEELVYFSLIAYPRYMDIETGEFASPEDIINKIRNSPMNKTKLNWPERQISRIVNVYRGLSYAP